MKKAGKIVLSVLSVLLFFTISLTAFASDSPNSLVQQVEEALDISVFHQKGPDRLIKCFDVNEDGSYAIGFRNNTIHVYDSLGNFQYGYRFSTDGDYGIILKENNIVIYLARSHTLVEIDPTGKCVRAEKVDFSKNTVDVDDIINRTCKQIRNVNYYLERDIGIFNGDYSRLVKIDENGNRIVLYDVTIKGYFAGASHYIILSIFPIAGIACLVAQIKKEEHGTDG